MTCFMALSLAALDYRERALTVKVKPESADPGVVGQLKGTLAARSLALTEPAVSAPAIQE